MGSDIYTESAVAVEMTDFFAEMKSKRKQIDN